MLYTFQPLIIYILDNKKQHQRRYKWQTYQPINHQKTRNPAPLLAYLVVSLAATNTKHRTYFNIDTDSGTIRFDNRFSARISHCIEDNVHQITINLFIKIITRKEKMTQLVQHFCGKYKNKM